MSAKCFICEINGSYSNYFGWAEREEPVYREHPVEYATGLNVYPGELFGRIKLVSVNIHNGGSRHTYAGIFYSMDDFKRAIDEMRAEDNRLMGETLKRREKLEKERPDACWG